MRGGMANKEYSKKYELFQKLDDKKKIIGGCILR